MTEFNRDRWGRPLIPVEGTLKPAPYARPSSLGKLLTDDTQLSKWMQRQVVLGMAKTRSLQVLATSVSDPVKDRDVLTQIVQRALDAAGSSDGADHGTTVHACIETILTGGDIDRFPENVRNAAWVGLNLLHDAGLTVMLCEQAVVNDELEAAGTFDILAHDADYQVFVVDTKTSKAHAPKYSALSWAVQLATYAYSEWLFDLETQTRFEWDTPPSYEVAYVLHLPSDNIDAASIIPVDIESGFRAAQLAKRVKACRKHKFIKSA